MKDQWLKVLILAVISSALMATGCSHHDDSPAAPAPAPISNGTPDAPSNTIVDETCQTASFPSGRALQYCIKHSTANTNPTNIVYFFHGLGGSASDIFKEPFATALRIALEELGSKMPHVVSLSFGSSVVIPVDTSGAANSIAGELMSIGLPKIESELGYRSTPPLRQLMGLSMGGFNVLSLAASQPKKFKTVMSLCPALIDFDPFTPSEIEAYIERHSPYVSRDRVNTAIAQLKANFPTREAWRGSDPLRQIPDGRYDSLSLFVSIGRQDEYGFIEGTQSFVNSAQARNLPVAWKPVNGPHCFFDLTAFIEFLKTNL